MTPKHVAAIQDGTFTLQSFNSWFRTVNDAETCSSNTRWYIYITKFRFLASWVEKKKWIQSKRKQSITSTWASVSRFGQCSNLAVRGCTDWTQPAYKSVQWQDILNTKAELWILLFSRTAFWAVWKLSKETVVAMFRQVMYNDRNTAAASTYEGAQPPEPKLDILQKMHKPNTLH